MSLADYLAKNYLTADPKPDKKSKKRKRKQAEEGLIIADDVHTGWEKNDADGGEDEDAPVMVTQSSAEFRKVKKSNWQTIAGAKASLSTSNPNDDTAAADAIIASAVAESAMRGQADADDEAPVVAEAEEAEEVERLESGAHAGLQTAAELAKQLARKAKQERDDLEGGGHAAMGKNADTIYRDASGRIVNVAMKRAEARAKAEAEAAKKAKEVEDAKGDVQRVQSEARRDELKDAKYIGVARYADDEDLNDELKEKERWNDPAARFIQEKKAGKSVTGRPLYKGSFPPNRYGIRPGHKWDGVDRANGFEGDWFKARNRQKNMRDLEYAWEMDE